MIRWIQRQSWQSSLILAAFGFFLFGGLDLLSIGIASLSVSVTFAIAVYFSRQYGWISIGLLVLGTIVGIVFGVRPGATGGISLLVLVLVAAFGSLLQQLVVLPVTAVAGIVGLWFSIYQLKGVILLYGMITNALGELNLFLFGALLISLACVLAWLAGRLMITRATHVGTSFDRAVAERTQAKLNLEIAEQNERFAIARDISELIIQRIAASISLAEGGVYATQADPSIASRVLEEVADSARAGHKELRRLFDMLNKTHSITAAPPRIDDLDAVVIAFRELGFNIALRHEGKRFAIDEGAELAIYRIVFDALENSRKHTQAGTDISVDFSWTENGLQVLIKDNGTEIANRGINADELSYSIEEDRRSLVETISGAGITAMTERAALYEGTIEATRVPGVGFTLSAIFPNLRISAKA